ncbi:metallophosphoesterase [Candidatus Saccharibacteria bacterium]|nr:metallophosphoesterase [Candidatus Saccharibacteria bacterium]
MATAASVSSASGRNVIVSVALGCAVAIIGYAVIVSLAAGPVASLESEEAVLSDSSMAYEDPTASESQAIMFKVGDSTDPGGGPDPGDQATIRIAAAGDIADNNGEQATSDIIMGDSSINTVLALGDLAYESGTSAEFAEKYDPTWGRFKNKTKPTPGNHEYYTDGASGYYQYWNNIEEYYSFDIGNWHLISLNSEINHSSDSEQMAWLKSDLAANASKQCTLAFWHTPRFSAGTHSDDDSVTPFFDELYTAGADLVLTGHSHIYERFAKSKSNGEVDEVRGIRNFVIGTGGTSLGSGGDTAATREFNDSSAHGVLMLDLKANSYDYKFVTVDGQTLDSGSDTCH